MAYHNSLHINKRAGSQATTKVNIDGVQLASTPELCGMLAPHQPHHGRDNQNYCDAARYEYLLGY